MYHNSPSMLHFSHLWNINLYVQIIFFLSITSCLNQKRLLDLGNTNFVYLTQKVLPYNIMDFFWDMWY